MRRRLTFANVTALLALCLAITSPAWSDPVADTAASAGKKVGKALKLGKQADKRSNTALKTATDAKATAARALAKGGAPGPQGATGATGATGAQGLTGTGAQGERGPSDGYFAVGANEVTLPVGKYVLIGYGHITNASAGASDVNCLFNSTGSGSFTLNSNTGSADVDAGEEATVTILGSTTVSTQTRTVKTDCTGNPSPSVTSQPAIVAISVADLHP